MIVAVVIINVLLLIKQNNFIKYNPMDNSPGTTTIIILLFLIFWKALKRGGNVFKYHVFVEIIAL